VLDVSASDGVSDGSIDRTEGPGVKGPGVKGPGVKGRGNDGPGDQSPDYEDSGNDGAGGQGTEHEGSRAENEGPEAQGSMSPVPCAISWQHCCLMEALGDVRYLMDVWFVFWQGRSVCERSV
jgi:hypothetical protein